MTCLYFRSLLDDLLDQELSPPLEASVKSHLEVCPDCRAEFEESVRLRELVSGLVVPEPSADYWRNSTDLILARTVESPEVTDLTDVLSQRSSERSSFYRALAAMAASLVIFFGSLLIGSTAPFSGEPSFTYLAPDADMTTESTPAGAARVNYISADEQTLIAGSMLLVGTPGMSAGSTRLGISPDREDGR